MKSNAVLAAAIVASWVIMGLIGWASCSYFKNNEILKLNDRLTSIIIADQRANVDHALRTLEISLQGKDPEFIAKSLEMAKEFSVDASGYGAERIREIESHIKK